MNKEVTKSIGKRGFWNLILAQRSLWTVVTCILLASIITWFLYSFTENLLKERLQERLVSIAATAASQFSNEDVSDIHKIKDADNFDESALESLVSKLGSLKEANSNIQYAYIMRRTNDPLVVEFVADALTLASEEEMDENGDGVVEEDELAPWPGDPYEIIDFPVLRNEAFNKPSVDQELQEDQWGLIMAAYAPIIDATGGTVAIIGIDVLVDDFRERTQAALLPFLLFIIFLIIMLAMLTIMLGSVWNDRVEAMREIDRQKDELLSIVSHQLATPVSSVKWYLEMMMDGDVGELNKEQKEHVDTMKSVTENLVDLVGMILDVSRIQLGKMKVDRTDLDLNEFFKEVLNTIEPKAKEQKVNFKKKIPSKMPVAKLDKRLMRMTLENLLSNAIKYTPENGSVDLDVSIKNNVLTYTVKDTGCGIPKEDQGKLFTKLFRASNVQDVNGNGFGLYVAKGAVESQGGKITFSSVEDKGTTFVVILPLNVV